MSREQRQGWGTPEDARVSIHEKKTNVYKQTKDLAWEPHPINKRVELCFILTKREDNVEVTCLLARIPKGEIIPEHTHKEHDIIFPLSGRGKIWIEGMGEFNLERGVLVNVPPGAVHKVYDVTEDMEIFDVFSGAII
jgi:quercetin dioxygenase-like cupin family protein